MSAPADAMDLPLDGIRAVEASAGTGKTFTIATLYLRLILERGLRIDEIVVATFTRAAAAELATRLRERLVLADELLAQTEPAANVDGENGVTLETRKVLRLALQSANLASLRQRTREACLAIDTAFIGTLHGFCHRVLAEFGFDTGQALAAPELIDDIRELETEIVRDFWRRGSADSDTAALLASIWKTPDALAAQVCDPRWRGRVIDPPAATTDVDVAERDCAAARAELAAWDETARARAAAEVQRAIGNANARNSRIRKLDALHRAAQLRASDAAFARSAGADANDFADAALTGKAWFRGPFQGAELAAVRKLANAIVALEACAAQRRDALLREAREYLESERPRRLAERNLMGHDEAVDRLAAALTDPVRGEIASRRIRARWKAALVDEFQDTDTRQWQIVHALFGDSTLVLVGDPKQAIYGFRGGDVHAWLEARAHAEGAPLVLRDSWRSGNGLCDAVNALFSRPAAFIDAGIGHPDIRSAHPERALLRDGEPLAALQVWWLDPETTGHAGRSKVPSKAWAEPAIQCACVAWIREMLDGRTQLRDSHGKVEPLCARHIAVLVNSNDQAAAMQAALGRAGVAAASNLRASVYASAEAADLALLLEALASPDDVRRARAAHASLLVGADAAAIAGTRGEDTQGAQLLETIAGWAAAAGRHGPLAWLHARLQSAAPRLLALPDGERRVANYLQLAELLQDLHARSFGLDDLATRFARARIDAHDDAEAARLRLDTDADAVTISTVHAAKGLEYPVVLVPYAALGHDPEGKSSPQPRLHWYHDEDNAAHVAIGACRDDVVAQRAIEDIRAEDIRKFYVAVTRAAALCVLPYGPTSATRHSAPFHLLHEAGRDHADYLDDSVDGCRTALRQLGERAGAAVSCVDLPSPSATARRAAADDEPLTLGANRFTRSGMERDWSVWSFSRLVRGSANAAASDPLPGAGDADATDEHGEDAASDAGLGGARFGTAVHAVFEQTDFAAWRDASDTPDTARALIESCLRGQGLAHGEAALKRALPIVGGLVRAALNTTLPCGVRLCDIDVSERKAEIEFHLTLAPARSADLFALLHKHGYQQQRSGVSADTLHGLLTGKIDLTFRHAGRFHIVDWKTNRCAPYDTAAMRVEIATHDYDLQWLVYTLALHRWLRQRLPDYDYDRDVGAVYYLFVRGMRDGGGVHADRPPHALIEAMDALFTAPMEAVA